MWMMHMPIVQYDGYANKKVANEEDWKRIVDDNENTRNDMCSICLRFAFDGRADRKAFQVPGCKHIFHIGCLKQALQNKRICPNCRRDIDPVIILCIEALHRED